MESFDFDFRKRQSSQPDTFVIGSEKDKSDKKLDSKHFEMDAEVKSNHSGIGSNINETKITDKLNSSHSQSDERTNLSSRSSETGVATKDLGHSGMSTDVNSELNVHSNALTMSLKTDSCHSESVNNQISEEKKDEDVEMETEMTVEAVSPVKIVDGIDRNQVAQSSSKMNAD